MIIRPPRVAEWLLSRSLAESDREAAMGDMSEELAARTARDGSRSARRWFWRQARRSFVAKMRERKERDPFFTGGTMKDVVHVIRGLLKAPAFTAVVLLTLALGIGASTTIFSVVDGVMLRPLPYPESDRLMGFSFVQASGSGAAAISPLTFQYWHDRARSFSAFAVTSGGSFNLVRGDVTERVRGLSGTADLFKAIGVAPELGRPFAADD